MENEAHHETIVREFTKQAVPFAEHPAHSQEDTLASIRTIANLRENDAVLDSGCGPGLVSCYLAGFVRQVTGVDLTPAMVREAKERAALQGITNTEFTLGDMEHLPYPDRTFDAAISRFAFHHLQRPEQALQEMFRVVRPGGKVVVMDAVPAVAKRDRFDTFEKLRDPSHASALTMEELIELGERHALTPVRVRRLRLRIELESHLTKSLSAPIVAGRLRDLVQSDAKSNLMDFRPEQVSGHWHIQYPLAVFAWELEKTS
jgi:ubiquinone/menaquinone biosynthesis C-methylase UbiE